LLLFYILQTIWTNASRYRFLGLVAGCRVGCQLALLPHSERVYGLNPDWGALLWVVCMFSYGTPASSHRPKLRIANRLFSSGSVVTKRSSSSLSPVYFALICTGFLFHQFTISQCMQNPHPASCQYWFFQYFTYNIRACLTSPF